MAVQSNGETASLIALMEQPTAPDTFADQYSQVIVGELAKILAEQGDATCRKARNLGEKELLRGADENIAAAILAVDIESAAEDAARKALSDNRNAGRFVGLYVSAINAYDLALLQG